MRSQILFQLTAKMARGLKSSTLADSQVRLECYKYEYVDWHKASFFSRFSVIGWVNVVTLSKLIIYLCDMHNNMHTTQCSFPRSFLANSAPAVNTVTLSGDTTMGQTTEISQCPKCLSEKNARHKLKVASKFYLNYELIELICLEEYCKRAKKVWMKVRLFPVAVLKETKHKKLY